MFPLHETIQLSLLQDASKTETAALFELKIGVLMQLGNDLQIFSYEDMTQTWLTLEKKLSWTTADN